MNKFIIVMIILLAGQSFGQSGLKSQVYEYAIKPANLEGLELSHDEAEVFLKFVFSQKIPIEFYACHMAIYSRAIGERKHGGFEVEIDLAKDLADYASNTMNPNETFQSIDDSFSFAIPPENEGGLGYNNKEAVKFAKKFALREKGLYKLKAYIHLYRFARSELDLNKKQALEYADRFLEEN